MLEIFDVFLIIAGAGVTAWLLADFAMKWMDGEQ